MKLNLTAQSCTGGRVTNYSATFKALTLSAMLFAAATAVVVPFNSAQGKSEPAHVAVNLKEINVNDGFAELVKAVRPAVVNISVTGSAPGLNMAPGNRDIPPEMEEFFRRFFGQIPGQQSPGNNAQPEYPQQRKTTAVGSGFIIDPEGLVVTNNHVIDNAESIEVVFEDGTRMPATLKGTDSKTDLALLKIEADHPLPYVVFGDSDAAEVGNWVVAIGNPFGLGGTTTSGIISARGRDIQSGPLDDFIQIDASINRGNSGGPLFNTKGEVIGVNSAIFSPNGGSVGIGFAIPSSMAENVIGQLAISGTVERGYLGVHIQAIDDEIAASLGLENDHGALVTEVMDGSPAQKSGFEAGDVIVSYDGQDLSKMRDLPKMVALTPNGSDVKVKIWRNDGYKTLKVKIEQSEDAKLALNEPGTDSMAPLGLELAKIDDQNRSAYGLDEETVGVIIVDVLPDSAAAQKGLRQGDVIKRVDQTDVKNPDDVKTAVNESISKDKKSVLLLVERENQSRFVVVPMKA